VLFLSKDYLADMESAIQQSCLDCALRLDRVFCDLPTHVLEALDNVKSTIACPRNSVLFREGQPARGALVLCEGRAKLSVCSESGKRLTLHIAVPGEVLGLSAATHGTSTRRPSIPTFTP
jgi:CRP/FNR family cyclic AMP-dependent transcriptional regulator